MGTVISKSSRIDACEASSRARDGGNLSGPQDLGRRESPGVLAEHMPYPAAHQLIRQLAEGGSPGRSTSRSAGTTEQTSRLARRSLAGWRIAVDEGVRCPGV